MQHYNSKNNIRPIAIHNVVILVKYKNLWLLFVGQLLQIHEYISLLLIVIYLTIFGLLRLSLSALYLIKKRALQN